MKKSQSSDYLNGLEKFLGINEEGNITMSPILIKNGSYQTPEGTVTYSIKDYGELKDTGNNILSLNIGDEPTLIGIGYYNISGTTSDYFDIYGVSTIDGVFEHIRLGDSEPGSEPIYEVVPFMDQIQSKLYTHRLTLTADKSYTLIYQSTNDLNVSSIADLRTITNVKATSDNVILPVCLTDLSGTAALQITTTLCKIGAANVTAVSDKVSTL